MKPKPAPYVPGNTEAERMDNAVRKMFSVSKEDYLKEEARRLRARKRPKKVSAKGTTKPLIIRDHTSGCEGDAIQILGASKPKAH